MTVTQLAPKVVGPCDCCGLNNEIFVHSSSLGPMSFASCKECLGHTTEPEFVFVYMYDFVSQDGEGLAPDALEGFSTYKEGRYWTWDEWKRWRQDPIRKAELDAKRDADLEAMNSDTRTGD